MTKHHFTVFDYEENLSTVRRKWKAWIQEFEQLLISKNITGNIRKRAHLLHYAGEEIFLIYKDLETSDARDTYEDVKRKLNEHFGIEIEEENLHSEYFNRELIVLNK